MNTQLTVGDSRQFDYGPTPDRITYTVTVTRDHEGISIHAQVGPNRNSTLSRTFLNDQLDEGRIFLAYLRDEAKAGKPVWLIEAGVSAVLAAAAVLDDAEQAMVEGIRANVERMTATQPTIDVSDIVGSDDGYQAERRRAREQAARFISRTQVHLKPPTEAELGRIRAARHNPDGTLTVTRAPGQPWTVLKALHARLGGTPTYKAGTARVIDTLTFPAEQLAGYLTEERAA